MLSIYQLAMTILGIDYGEKHIGLSIGSTDTGLALPLSTLHNESLQDVPQLLVDIAEREGAEVIVVGVPLSMKNGEASATQLAIEEFIAALEELLSLPVHVVDERLSSQGAAALQREGGTADDHSLAAMIILQTWLDTNENTKSQLLNSK